MTASPAPAANALQPVSVIVFPGGFNWPIWIAQDKGYFARGGIEVVLTPTPNSVFQLTNLIDGKFDIAMTAIDNVIAYMEGQGEASTVSKPDLLVFMGGDNGFLSLVGIPEIKRITDLKSKTVSVDALTTGYAFVLLDLLKRAGLKQADYKIEKAGGVLARWEALKEKKHDATMLITPFDIFARNAGLNVLQYAIGVYGHYQAWHVAMWWVGGGWEGQDPPGCHRQLGSGADPVPGGDGLDLRQGRAKPVSGDPHRCRRPTLSRSGMPSGAMIGTNLS